MFANNVFQETDAHLNSLSWSNAEYLVIILTYYLDSNTLVSDIVINVEYDSVY